MKNKTLLVIIGLILIASPQVHADLIVNEIGSIGGEPSAIAAIDSDSDSVPDTAVVGTSSRAMAFGTSPWSVSVTNVFGVASADFDKSGYMNGVIIAGGDIVAVGPTGVELWRAEKLLGKSVVAADLDGDGYKDEVVVGCWDRVAAFDSDGESLWNYTEIAEKNVMNVVLTEKSIIASAGKMLYFFSFSGNLRAGKAQNDTIVAISPIDMDGDGTMNGVVVITRGGSYAKINAYTMYGESRGWSTSLYHDLGIEISASPIDRYSTGKKDTVVINLYSGAYWVNSQGVTTKIGDVYAPGAIAPIDFDGDGILDDLLVSTKGTAKGGKLYAYSAYGQELAFSNKTGGVKIAVVDLTFDGKANDAIVAASFDRRTYSVISDVSDSTTSATTQTTTTGTGGISVDLGPDISISEMTLFTLSASAVPSTSGVIIVSYIWTEDGTLLGQEKSLSKIFPVGEHEIKVVVTDNTGAKAEDTVKITVTAAGTGSASSVDSDSDGWTDELELQMGTDPNDPDTDGDGTMDPRDPNPLVSDSKKLLTTTLYAGVFVFAVSLILALKGVSFYMRKKRAERERIHKEKAELKARIETKKREIITMIEEVVKKGEKRG